MELPQTGTKVRTKAKLEKTTGMTINSRHLSNRKPNTDGVYIGLVPGHGGDVWWVDHGDGDVAAYCYDELDVAVAEPGLFGEPR